MSRHPPFTIAVVTGTRADFGLLSPVMRAIDAHPDLHLAVVICGAHLLDDGATAREVHKQFDVIAEVPMQRDGRQGRAEDVLALARGVSDFGQLFDETKPDVVLVLGDRIEAFAAATAGSVGGTLVAHIHGGDCAEGVADEAMRHAITKLAHIHFPATELSAQRIVKMGEDPGLVYCVGSPAIDGLDAIEPLSDQRLTEFGIGADEPFAVVVHHPTGLPEEEEAATMHAILEALDHADDTWRYVLTAPNHDPGRAGILVAVVGRRLCPHLPRSKFVGLLKRATFLIGNSSAGLIEAAALRVWAVNVGSRQSGRERCGNVIDVQGSPPRIEAIKQAIAKIGAAPPPATEIYGNGHAGERIAAHLARALSPGKRPPIRKQNQY